MTKSCCANNQLVVPIKALKSNYAGGSQSVARAIKFMEPERPSENPEPIRKVLREWKVTTSLPPRFQEQVWQRIERAQTQTVVSGWSVIAHWVDTVLRRPALAASYVAVLLTIGVTAGWAQARQETGRVKAELGQRYVRVLDPYLAPRP